MGQTSSQLNNNQTHSQIANFFHICNIIPDTPEHHHLIWSPSSLKTPPANTTTNKTSQSNKQIDTPQSKRPSSSHIHSNQQSYAHSRDEESTNASSTIDQQLYYTTDDESDTYQARVRRVRRHKHRRSTRSNRSQKHVHHSQSEGLSENTDMDNTFFATPEYLDRRYDLDIAPSMVNMDLRFNGALMVVSALYNIFLHKFGYQHMLSVQMLYWMAVHKYYQIHNIDCKGNYKLSLCTLLDVVKELSLCSERELSIYTDIVQKERRQTPSQRDDSSLSEETTPAPTTIFAVSTIASQEAFCKPFYRMQHYYVPKDIGILKHALLQDRLILANLTLFSNFLSSRGGVIRFPNSTDQSAGMIVVTIVGYQEDMWIVKFPFGLHWGENGCGYVPFDYFDRYNRDRWVIDVDECGEPPEYIQQRKRDQMSETNGLLAAHMDDQVQHTRNGTFMQQPTHTPTQSSVSTCQNAHRMRRRVF